MLPSETHWPTNLVLTHCRQYCQKYQKLKFCLCWAWYYCYFQIYQFKSEFQSFLTTIVNKLFEKTPLAYSLAWNLTCLDPNRIMTDKEGCCAKFNVGLSELVKCRRLNIRDCDSLVLQYSEFLDLAIKAEKSAMEGFNFKVDRLDIFLQKHIGSVSSMSKLWDLLRELLILSHGQATVERGFLCGISHT